MNALYVVILFLWLGFCSSAVVNISLSAPTSLSENQKSGVLPVLFDVAVTTDNVKVVCSTVQTKPGSTKLTFSDAIALVGQTTANVSFSIGSAGQPISIQCSGQSDGNGNQFNLLTSKGNIRSLQVTKAPVVSVCSDKVLVDTSLACQTVPVQLSEQVAGSFPAVVVCATIGNAAGSPQFKFEPTIAEIGKSKVDVPYIILSNGNGVHSVQVTCNAQTYAVVITSNFTCGKSSGSVPPVAVVPDENTTATLPTAAPKPDIIVSNFTTSLEGVTTIQYALDTSTSQPVTFHTPELTLHPAAATIHGSYAVNLALSTPQNLPLDVECSLSTAQSRSSLLSCPTKPVSTVTLAKTTIQLKLAGTEIQFKKNEVLKTLRLTLSGTPAMQIKDLVQLTCCPKKTTVPVPSPVRVFLFVELYRQQTINWALITAGKRASTPALDVDLSCPCNLIQNGCDSGCCCDKECSESERAAFTCVSGFFGGASVERPFEFSCQATWPDSTDWQPVICVTINNSPFQGYFYNYTSPAVAQDTPEYNSLIGTVTKTRFSYEAASKTTSPTGGTYKLGTTIKTAANSKDTSYLTASLGTLSLPRNVYNGLCSQMAPVRFLENQESGCVVELTESLCTGSSTLSASSYLMSRSISNPACPVAPAVLKDGSLSKLQDQPPNLADTLVEYYCTSDATSALVKHRSGTEGAADDTTSSLFSTGTPNTKTNNNWRCAFDDGKTPPPSPTYNSATKTCSNVVLNVTYQLEWRAQEVVRVKVTLVMGDVVFGTPSQTGNLATSESAGSSLTQWFVTKFVHFPLYNPSDASVTPPVTTNRSGNPGYIRGLPLNAAKLTGESYTLDKLSLWSPSEDGLCATSSTTDMLYGQATSTGCLLRMSLDDMRDCTQLRELVRTNQDALIQATHVARTGNAQISMSGDWLPIIREPFTVPVTKVTNFTTVTTGECTHVPAGLRAEVLVSEAGKYRGVPQMEVVAMKISYHYTTWRFYCVSGYGLGCLDVTATPPGSYKQKLQYFMVKSSVVFVNVPPTEPARVKRSFDQTGLCYTDVCKEELFYPLSPSYQGEPREKVVAFSLILIFMALITFAFTKPWG